MFPNSTSLMVDEGAKIKLSTEQVQSFKPGAVFDVYPPNGPIQPNSGRFYLGGPIQCIDFHGSGAHFMAVTHHPHQDPSRSAPNNVAPVLKTPLFQYNPNSNISFQREGLYNSLIKHNVTQHVNMQPSAYNNPALVDSQIHLFDSLKGIHKKSITIQKHIIDIAKFTHHYSAILHSGVDTGELETSIKQPPFATLCYTSLFDNTLLQQFRGHRAIIDSITLNPCHDSFVSSSAQDGSVRLWDLRSEFCQGLIRTNTSSNLPSLTSSTKTLTAIDPQGVVLAVALTDNSNCIKLYDFRALERGPFSTIFLSNLPPLIFTSLQFTADGTAMLVTAIPQVNLFGDDEKAFRGDTMMKDDISTAQKMDNGDIDDLSTQNQSGATFIDNFINFNYVLLLDSFSGQILQRIATPRCVYPLDQQALKILNATSHAADIDDPTKYAPLKIQGIKDLSTPIPPALQTPDLNPTQPLNLSNPNSHYFQQIQHPAPTLLPGTSLAASSQNVPEKTVITDRVPNYPPPHYSVPCSITTDCKYITYGTHIGSVPTHDTRNGRQITTYTHKRQGEVMHVKWNPVRTQLVTVDPYELVFWVPASK